MEAKTILKNPFNFSGKGKPSTRGTTTKFTYTPVMMVLTTLIISLSADMQAQSSYALKSVKATIQGTSSLHDWESNITKIQFKGSLLSDGKTLKTIKDVEVKVPVESIKSKEGKIMDNKTYNAFKYEQNPFIIYSFSMAQAKTVNNAVTIETTGNLTMAGVTKPIPLSAKGNVLPNGDLQLAISRKLKMTDFKMVPPTAMMGAIKVGDEVTVNFDLVLTQTQNNNK
jgi:polyisoprenoid-binding protein YceI